MDGIIIVVVMLLAYRELKRLAKRFSAFITKSNESRDNLVKSTDLATENNIVIADLQRQLIEVLKENKSLKAKNSTSEDISIIATEKTQDKQYAFLKPAATIKKSNVRTQH